MPLDPTFIPASADATQAALDAKAESPIPRNARFVTEGDSITNPNLIANPTQTSWVPIFATLPNCAGRGTVSNVAVSGSTTAAMVARYASTVYPLRPQSGEPVYLITLSGANDGGASAAAYLALMEPYWAQAKVDGFTVVAITQIPLSGSTINMAGGVLGSTIPDIIINTGNVFSSSSDSITYLGDGIHLTAIGARLLAEAVNDQITKSANPTSRIVNVGQKGLGVGTTTPLARVHAIDPTSQIRLGNVLTANTMKTAGMSMEHYDSGAPIDFFGGNSSSGSNLIYIGRGASAHRAATGVQFWLGSSPTATAASSVMYGYLAGGKWVFGSLASGVNGSNVTVAINDTAPGISGSTTSSGTSKQSWLVARPASNGYVAVGSLAGELIVAAESDKSIGFATVVGAANFQTVRMRLKATGVLNMVSTPVYADNAAAISGGLVVGDEYRTATGVKMEVYTP